MRSDERVVCGIDAMAYLALKASNEDVTRSDFVRWVDRYLKFRCEEQLTGLDLYGARCAMLHSYAMASDLSRKTKCRQVGYMDKSVPAVRYAPNVSKDMVLVSVPALADAFFCGVDKSLVDLFLDKKAPIAEQRLKKLLQAMPFKRERSDAL
jgi:hypothetical protein